MPNGSAVLVTGASGFIGSHLCEALLAAGHSVVAFDALPLAEAVNLRDVRAHHTTFTYLQGDVRDMASLQKAFTSDIHTVYHLASVVGVSRYIEDPFLVFDVTVGGTRNVAELASRWGTRILFTSTSEVYGRNPTVPWAEDDDRVLGSTQVDRWSYATSKACCEHMLWGLYRTKKVPVTVVRYFNVYGPRQHPIFVVSQSVHRALNGERPLLYDGGVATRCFTYVDDAIQGTIRAATHAEGVGEVFNIGNDREVTTREVVELVIHYSGKNVSWQHVDTRQHYGKVYEDIGRRIPDVRKAGAILSWQAAVSHEDGIRRTVEWARDNPWWLKA